MTTEAPAPPGKETKDPALKPRDAATLILVDRSAGLPRILLGRRRPDLKFMPGKYVFPGGRVDRGDRTAPSSDELPEPEIAKLLVDMKGTPSPARARAIAMAAIRETYEEAGIIIGAPVDATTKPPTDEGWAGFFAEGYLPSLARLVLFARAITPPGRPRRFDTRFFCVETTAISHRGKAPHDELSDLVWMSLEEARGLDLPPITRTVIEDLGDRMRAGPLSDAHTPVPYYYFKNNSFRRELITLPAAST